MFGFDRNQVRVRFPLACKALLQAYPKPTREQIGRYLNGNICRCGAYVQILEAIQDVVSGSWLVKIWFVLTTNH